MEEGPRSQERGRPLGAGRARRNLSPSSLRRERAQLVRGQALLGF